VNDLIFFSYNQHKVNEVKNILEKTNFKILTLKELPKTHSPEETGDTFKKNAIIKSRFGFEKFKKPCFADDSGICISALNNKPGVYSKRFQEEYGKIQNVFSKIIKEAERKNDFNAFFQSSVALTIHSNKTVCFEGVVKGKISKTPKGTGGFQYDPIFIPNGNDKTYAEMLSKDKNLISHRAIAIRKLKIYLDKLIN